MNCLCNPPKPAVVRTTNKEGQNKGREFFCCDSNDAAKKCDLFHWVGAPMPFSLTHRPKQTSNLLVDVKKPGRIQANICLYKFENGPPMRVWFSITSPPNTALTKYFTSLNIDLRQFLNGLKLWVFDFILYEEIVSRLLSTEFEETIQITELPRFLTVGLRKYLQNMPKFSVEPVLNLETGLLEFLLPFQLEGIRFVVRHGGRALIGDEMGCGKTVQAIGVLQHYRGHWPALIMMPPILCKQWYEELMNFCADILAPHEVVTLLKGSDRVPPGAKVVIVTYSIIDKLVQSKALTPQQFGVVIADESHNLKSSGAKRTEGALPFLKGAVVALCLTGTPLPNRPLELFTQVSGLLPGIFSDYDGFGRRYCDPKPARFGNGSALEFKGSSNEGELRMVLEGTVMIRRLKEDVIKTMPAKCRELRYVTPEGPHVGEIGKIQKRQTVINNELKAFDCSTDKRNALVNEQQQLLNRFYQVTGLCKIKAIREELFRLVDEARLERGRAQSNADKVAMAVKTSEAVNSTGTDVSCSSSSHSSDVATDESAQSSSQNKLLKQLQLAERLRSFNVREDDTLSLPFSRSNSLSSHEGDVTAAVVRDLEEEEKKEEEMKKEEEEEDLEVVASPKRKNATRRGSTKASSSNITTSSSSCRASKSAPVLMELEDDLVQTRGEEKKNDEEEDDLLDSCDEGRTETTRTLTTNKKRRLVKGGTSGGRPKRVSEVSDWREEDEEEDFLGTHSKGRKRAGRLVAVRDLTDSDSDGESTSGEGESDLFSEEEEEEEFEVVSVARKGSKRGKAAVPTKTPPAKSAFVEMAAASKAAGLGSATKPKRGKKTAAACPEAIEPPSLYSGLGQKIIVFVHHKDVMDAVEEALRELSVQYVRIDGAVTGPNRNKLISKFQKDDVTDVALLSITACGTGLNLTRANVALFGELYWSPGVVLQAEDRIHRLGQKSDSVRIVYLVARNSADDIVWEQIQKKHNMLGATVGIADQKGGAGIGRGMTIGKRQNERDKGGLQGTLDLFVVGGDKPPSLVVGHAVQEVDMRVNSVGVPSSYRSSSSSSSSSSASSAPNPYSYAPYPAATVSTSGIISSGSAAPLANIGPFSSSVPPSLPPSILSHGHFNSQGAAVRSAAPNKTVQDFFRPAGNAAPRESAASVATRTEDGADFQYEVPNSQRSAASASSIGVGKESGPFSQSTTGSSSYVPYQPTSFPPVPSSANNQHQQSQQHQQQPQSQSVNTIPVAQSEGAALEMTAEMRQRMERNRQLALEKRAAALRREQQQGNPSHIKGDNNGNATGATYPQHPPPAPHTVQGMVGAYPPVSSGPYAPVSHQNLTVGSYPPAGQHGAGPVNLGAYPATGSGSHAPPPLSTAGHTYTPVIYNACSMPNHNNGAYPPPSSGIRHNPAVNLPPGGSVYGMHPPSSTSAAYPPHVPQFQQQQQQFIPQQTHVFNTGRGSSISTTEQGQKKADLFFAGGDQR